MSNPPEDNRSQYICSRCGTMNNRLSPCVQCQSNNVVEEEISNLTRTSDDERMTSDTIDNSPPTLLNELNLQSLANILFLTHLPASRHRRTRTSRRIKRVSQTHRSSLMPHLRLFNVNDIFLRQTLPTNLALVQVPFQFFIINNQSDNLQVEWPDENIPLTLTTEEINQLTSISSEHEY